MHRPTRPPDATCRAHGQSICASSVASTAELQSCEQACNPVRTAHAAVFLWVSSDTQDSANTACAPKGTPLCVLTPRSSGSHPTRDRGRYQQRCTGQDQLAERVRQRTSSHPDRSLAKKNSIRECSSNRGRSIPLEARLAQPRRTS